jgi:hypothetical protein
MLIIIILLGVVFLLSFIIFMIISDYEMVKLDEQWMKEYKKWKEK